MKLQRGLRNNNPLNIRIGNDWKFERVPNTDGVFEQFTEMRYGVRAAFILLRNYINKYHRNTVRKIINSWAPTNENDTLSYIRMVASGIGISPDDEIRFEDREMMVALVRNMAYVENGVFLDDEVIVEGYEII